MFKRRFYAFLAPEGDGAASGAAGAGSNAGAGGSSSAGAGGAAAGAAGGENGAGAGAGAQASALTPGGGSAAGGAGSAGAAAGAAGAGSAEVTIPEKFVVKGADGQIDHAATALKLAGSYTAMEKRQGSGEVRPETVEGYKVNLPDALKDKVNVDILGKNESFKAFLGAMHTAGASQKVVDVAISEMLSAGGMTDPTMQMAECVSTLKGLDGWKSQPEYDKNIGFAFNATKSFAEKAGVSMDDIAKSGLNNNPAFIRLMAAIGPEIAEDRGASPESRAQLQGNLDTLMANPAYLNAHHPQHATIVAQVDALTKQQVGQRPVGAGMSHSFRS